MTDEAEQSIPSCGSVVNHSAFPNSWIPVTERLPEEGQRVLAYEKPDVIVVAEMHSRMPLVGGFWWSTDNGHTAYSVFPTHWMPLPAPPTDGK
jgi:hypothetical protein